MPVNTPIQIRRGLSTEWESINPILATGEPGFDTTNNILKIGDGINTWADRQMPATSDIYVYAKNATTGTLYKGQAVYINGALGNNPTLQLAIATGDVTSSKTLGLLKQDLAVNDFGYVVSEGILDGIDTDGASAAGDPIWLSPSISGGLLYGTDNKPYAPNHMVFIGYVLRKQLNNGRVYIKIQNGYELEELHNVAVTGATNGQFLQKSGSNGLWIPSSSGNFTTLLVNGTGVSLVGHTHTSSQITDFNSSVSGLLPVINIISGSGISVSSSSGSFTISSTASGGGGSVSPEDVMDILGTGLIGGTGISISYNDTNGTINVNLYASAITGYEELTTTKDTFTVSPGYLTGNLEVYYNGLKLINGQDYTATNGSSFTLAQSGVQGDVIEWAGLGGPAQYAQVSHSHTSSDISDFNSAVSGLLPTISNSGNNRILTSTGSSIGINAESNFTFDGTTLSHSAGNFASAGDAQHSILIARRTTTDATSNVVLTLDGDTPGVSNRLVLSAKSMWVFNLKLSAYNDTDSTGAWWIFRGGIRRDGANTTALIGSLITENDSEGNMSSASASIVADDTNDALEIRVTGLSSKNIRWVGVLDISQVSY